MWMMGTSLLLEMWVLSGWDTMKGSWNPSRSASFEVSAKGEMDEALEALGMWIWIRADGTAGGYRSASANVARDINMYSSHLRRKCSYCEICMQC
tara:strand:+ start:75 stop:359 length:285 start_codon:yes stop_codon:yes gene_type:complete